MSRPFIDFSGMHNAFVAAEQMNQRDRQLAEQQRQFDENRLHQQAVLEENQRQFNAGEQSKQQERQLNNRVNLSSGLDVAVQAHIANNPARFAGMTSGQRINAAQQELMQTSPEFQSMIGHMYANAGDLGVQTQTSPLANLRSIDFDRMKATGGMGAEARGAATDALTGVMLGQGYNVNPSSSMNMSPAAGQTQVTASQAPQVTASQAPQVTAGQPQLTQNVSPITQVSDNLDQYAAATIQKHSQDDVAPEQMVEPQAMPAEVGTAEMTPMVQELAAKRSEILQRLDALYKQDQGFFSPGRVAIQVQEPRLLSELEQIDAQLGELSAPIEGEIPSRAPGLMDGLRSGLSAAGSFFETPATAVKDAVMNPGQTARRLFDIPTPLEPKPNEFQQALINEQQAQQPAVDQQPVAQQQQPVAQQQAETSAPVIATPRDAVRAVPPKVINEAVKTGNVEPVLNGTQDAFMQYANANNDYMQVIMAERPDAGTRRMQLGALMQMGLIPQDADPIALRSFLNNGTPLAESKAFEKRVSEATKYLEASLRNEDANVRREATRAQARATEVRAAENSVAQDRFNLDVAKTQRQFNREDRESQEDAYKAGLDRANNLDAGIINHLRTQFGEDTFTEDGVMTTEGWRRVNRAYPSFRHMNAQDFYRQSMNVLHTTATALGVDGNNPHEVNKLMQMYFTTVGGLDDQNSSFFGLFRSESVMPDDLAVPLMYQAVASQNPGREELMKLRDNYTASARLGLDPRERFAFASATTQGARNTVTRDGLEHIRTFKGAEHLNSAELAYIMIQANRTGTRPGSDEFDALIRHQISISSANDARTLLGAQ